MEIIRANPDKPWNWDYVSRNPNLTMDIIKEFPNVPWNWRAISWNPNLTMKIIRANPDMPWNWDYVSRNPNLTMDIIKEFPDKLWNWRAISANPNITYDFVVENLDKIDFDTLSYNNLNYDPWFSSEAYRRMQTKRMHDRIYEELIKVACTPRRVLQWNEDTSEPDHPFYGLSQADIDRML
jgi:hypothetical protein